MVLILLGAPGAGKGTQAEYLTEALKVPVLSTGNLLREAIAQGTELGRQASAYMDKGQLVPDGLIVDLALSKLSSEECRRGAILDGFPRTVAQAQALDARLPVDVALSIEVPDEQIVERMAGRRTCPHCQSTYHVVSNPPRAEGVCDKCGAQLGVRRDDEPATVRQRLSVYHSQTEPVKAHYEQQHKLLCVEGVGTVAEIRQRIAGAMEAWL